MDNKQRKLCNNFSKYPMIQVKEPVLIDVSKDLNGLLEVKRIKKRKVMDYMYKSCTNAKYKSTATISCEYPLQQPFLTADDFIKFTKYDSDIEMSRFQEKRIRRAIQARGLEDKFSLFIDEVIKEVKLEHKKIVQCVGINLKIKSSHSEQKFVLMPYKFKGKTEKYNEFLMTRKLFKRKWILYYPIIRKVQSECILYIPSKLFQLKYNNVIFIDELKISFNEHIRKAEQIISEFCKKILSIIKKEMKTFNSNHYLKVITGLLTLHISQSIIHTIQHIVEFTAAKEPIPYIFLEVTFNGDLILEPTPEKLEDIYYNLIDNILDISNEIYELESANPKNVNLFITKKFIVDCKEKIKQNINLQFEPITDYLDNINKINSSVYKDLYSNEFLESIVDMIFEEGCKKINYYRKYLNKVLFIPDYEFFRIARISFINYKRMLYEALNSNINLIFEKIAYQHFWEVNDICETFQHIKMRAIRIPETTEELVETGKYMNYIKNEYLEILNERIEQSLSALCKIIDLGLITEEHRYLNYMSIQWLTDIVPIVEQYSATFDSLKYEAEERLQRVVEDVGEMIKNVFPLLTQLNDMDNIASSQKYIHFITLHMKKIKEIELKIEWINQEEATLSFPKSTYSEYEELKRYVYPFHHLLHLCLKVKLKVSTWQDGPFENLNYELTENYVEEFHKELTKTYKIYRQKLRQAQDENLPLRFTGTVDDPDILNWPAPLKLCGTALKLIEDFKPAVQIMKIICNKSLLKRHWQAMSEIAGVDVTPNAGTTLKKIMQVNFFSKIEEYEIISVGATKEKLLLAQLNVLQEQWDSIQFQTSIHKSCDIRILIHLDEIETVIIDQTTIIFDMQSSVFVKPFEKEVKEFHETIIKISKTIKHWHKIQTVLIKLFPLISLEQLNDIIPKESELLKNVIDIYNTSIDLIEVKMRVIKIVRESNLTNDLESCIQNLEIVFQGICFYLDEVRKSFPRFYFISNDEFIKALSNTKVVLLSDIFLNKLFQGITCLQINNNEITGTLNKISENLHFIKPVSIESSLEKTFIKVEEAMKSTFKNEIMECYQNFFKLEFIKLFKKYCEQTIKVVTYCIWTENIEMSLYLKSDKNLTIHLNNLDSSIINKIKYVKGQNLNNYERLKIKSIIITEMYIKTIIKKVTDSNTIAINSFEWEAHFKYYLKNGSLKIAMMNYTTEYMYEYLKPYNYIITPVSERYLRILISIFFMNYCGLVNGKSDSGKFETVNILASIFGNFVLNFVCGKDLSSNIIERIIKGTLLCGSWVYFENFINLKLDVMSTISEYLFSIQVAKNENSKYCFIGGLSLNFKRSCFINMCTINNSYTVLPASIQKFFRVSTLLKPDNEKIAEIMLYIEGFASAKATAKKIAYVINYLDGILYKKQNYYLGLTKLLQVLKEIENIKIENRNLNEVDIIFSAMIQVLGQAIPTENYNELLCVINNIFPTGSLVKDKNILEKSIQTICDEEELQCDIEFSSKITELYRTLQSDRSVLLVGNTCSFKTTMIKICKRMFEILDNQLIGLFYLTPNCFDYRSLYGFYTDSHEWIDGVLTKLCRFNEISTSASLIIFDGNVNPDWIENINPIVKEKRLYLESGEILTLLPLNKVLFEVDNLDNCSPSMISQSTVIFINLKTIKWLPIVSSWISTCKAAWMQDHKTQIHDIFCWIISASLEFLRENCVYIYPLSEINLINNIITLTTLIINDAIAKNKKDDDLKNMTTWIQATIIQAGMLGFGSILDLSSKHKFDEFYKLLWRGQNSSHPYPKYFGKLEVGIPQDGLLMDYQYIFKQRGNWKLFQDLLKSEKMVKTSYMHNILVPTIDSMRYIHILNLYIQNHLPVLLIGPSSTGKSILIEHILKSKLEEKKWDISYLNFNIYFDAQKTQHTILSKLNKRKGGIYSPPVGKDFIVFIDNLNQISSDNNGYSSCTELLRQYLDHGVWYDFNCFSEIYIHNFNIISAMNITKNKASINLRFLRHFHIFGYNELSEEITTRIYSNILVYVWRQNGFPSDTATIINQIVEGTYAVYKTLQTKIRPTLRRPYYCFNLNHFSNVIRGCSLLKKETYDGNKKICLKLWIHENLRVFGDRLNALDRAFLENTIKEVLISHFSESVDEISDTSINEIILSTINDRDSDDMKYEEVDTKNVLEMLNDELVKYNMSNKIKINVVYSEYAIDKIFKISRILSLDLGNALFVGHKGLGQISLTKLVAYIYGCTIFQPTITKDYTIENWKNELKRVLREAGAIEHRSIFLVSERELINEEFLQYVEQLLQNADIYDIFNAEEKQEILELSRLSAQGGNRNLDISSASVFLHFSNCYKKKLHLMLCLSSNAKQLRIRFRNFSSLKNCHIIFWDDWPDEALKSSAEILMSNIEVESHKNSKCIDTFIYFHRQFQIIARDGITELPIKLCISPNYFFHLVKLFIELFNKEKGFIKNKIDRFSQGLAKLSYAAGQILDMERVLADYTPQLAEMTAKAIEMTEQIALETIEVERASELVRQDEKIACEQAIVAQSLKSECEAELAQAIPILEDAISALNTLKPSDITLVKSMKNPPDAIKLVMAAVCVIKDIKPDRIPDPSTGRKTFDYWGPSKRILGDMNFLQTLKDFDKDNIKSEIMVKIRKEFLPHKDFKPNIVAKASSAAEGLCKWIIAMDMYDKVAKEVAPKKEKLRKAEKDYADTMEILNEKKEEVKRIEEKLAALNALLEDSNKRQVKLQKEVDLCNKKLISAQKLIGSLSEEQIRWTEAVKKLERQKELLLGNIILTTGIVVYLASLNCITRHEITDKWREYISHYLDCSSHFKIDQSFSSKFKIEVRKQTELLRDCFFLENILIYDFSKQYSIFIDPDYQADNWIKKSEKGNNLTIVTFFQNDFLNKLKNCIVFGNPLLIRKITKIIPNYFYSFISKYQYVDNDNTFLCINNEVVKLNTNFRIYMVCNLIEPNFSSEIFSKLTVVNFTISPTFLTKHLLRIVSEFEKPTLKKEKKEIYGKKNKYQLEITNTETFILKTLCKSQADILEDEESIKILEDYKIILKSLRLKYEDTNREEQIILDFTNQYITIAKFARDIYFFVSNLRHVNYIYQFSFDWFIYLYFQSVLYAEKSKVVSRKCDNIIKNFLIVLYKKINYCLDQKHKFTFAFLLTTFLLKQKNVLSNDELITFIYSFSEVSFNITWKTLSQLENLPVFFNFRSSFRTNFNYSWQNYIKKEEYLDIPEPWKSKLTNFQKLILIKVFKPEYVYVYMKHLVFIELGPQFLNNFIFQLNDIYNESYSLSPILLISTSNNDCLDELYILIKKKQLCHTFRSICISNHVYMQTDSILREAQEKGYWVLFQNCHLNKVWLEDLEKTLEDMNYENTNNNFRLWMTTEPSQDFPISLLQNSIKLTSNNGGNFKQILEKNFNQEYISDYFYNGFPGKKEIFTKLLFGLLGFHSCLVERSFYDCILWNVPYSLDENVIKISPMLLQHLLNDKDISCNDINNISFLIANYHYGSQVDNKSDLDFIKTMLSDFVNNEIIKNRSSCFGDLKEYYFPMKCDYLDYSKVINKYPETDNTEILGVHKKLGTIRKIINSNEVIKTLLNIFSIQSEWTIEDNQINLISKVDEILNLLPEKLDVGLHNDLILRYEFKTYNTCIETILRSLTILKQSLSGFEFFTDEIENIAVDIFYSHVPKDWEKFTYPTKQNLPEFLKQFKEKINYLRMYKPDENCIWLAAFLFPKAILCKKKLELSNQIKISVENIIFCSELSNDDGEENSQMQGILITGLFIANAQWDIERQCLCEVSSRIYNKCPPILLKPINILNLNNSVKISLFQTFDLKSFICNIQLSSLPMGRHWIKRGVKFVCHVPHINKYETHEYKTVDVKIRKFFS